MKKICVDSAMADELAGFVADEGIGLGVVTEQGGDVTVAMCHDRRQSDLETIYSGGWVACEAGRALAGKLQITVGQMGRLLNYLDVKIRKCELGCF